MIHLATLFQTLMLMQGFALAQQPESNAGSISTSGTLNILFANKNGFVIAADSRMSGKVPFQCAVTGTLQLHCDNSQKLFRTSPKSALVIAGFAIDGQNSPLNLAIASVLLRQFGPHGMDNDDHAQFVPDQIKNKLSKDPATSRLFTSRLIHGRSILKSFM